MTTRRLILTPTEALAAYKGELAEVRRKVTRGNSRCMTWKVPPKIWADSADWRGAEILAQTKRTVALIVRRNPPDLALELMSAIQPGDVLWGAEAWQVVASEYSDGSLVIRYADDALVRKFHNLTRSSFHHASRLAQRMPQWASRHRFTVTSVGADVSGEWPEWVIEPEACK